MMTTPMAMREESATSGTKLQRFAMPFALCYLLGLAIILLLFHTPVLPVSRQRMVDFLNFYSVVPSVFAVVCAWTVSGENCFSAGCRYGWRLIAIACGCLAMADTLWGIYEFKYRTDMWLPSPADIFYLALFPFLITGLILLLGPIPLTQRIRVTLDSALTASSAGILYWYFLLNPFWPESNLTPFAKIVNLMYPVVDIAALFIALILLLSSTSGTAFRRTAYLIVGAITLWTLGDTFYVYHSLRGTYAVGFWFEATWPTGSLLMAFAALHLLNSSSAARDQENASTWFAESILPEVVAPESLDLQMVRVGALAQTHRLLSILWPYIAALFSLSIVAAHDYFIHGSVGDTVMGAGALIFLLALGRQVFTLLQNDRLARSLRDLNGSLEEIVERRTQQLRSLHGLTRAVASTLEAEEVVRYALQHTRQALGAEAAVIWLQKNAEPSPESDAASGEDAQPNNKQAREVVLRHSGIEPSPEVLETLNRHTPQSEPDIFAVIVEESNRPRTLLCLRAPLWWQNRQLGSVGVLRSAEWDQSERDLLESIGLEIGASLVNAQRFGEAIEAADRDAVTGLLNHRAIARMLDESLRHATAEQPLSVIMMDLNNFKWFNDTYGHPAGDAVLRRTAQLLLAACRQGDMAARYGGDEFLAVLPNADAESARVVAERLDARVRIEGFRRKGESEPIPMVLSYGIATYPFDSANRHDLLALADANLYAYKAASPTSGVRTRTQRDQSDDHFSKSSFEALDAMITAINKADHYTRRHSEDVTEYALLIAHEIGLSPETLRVLRIGALLHDVGKISVPEEILRKPSQLSPEEFEIMKRHPHLGALICAGIPGMKNIVEIVRSHHERWDGQGYPDGLAGEEIPVLARLLAVADAFSAMTTSRPYRSGITPDQAFEEVRKGIGTQFDPQMARAFLHATRNKFE